MPGETEAREDWILCDGGSDGKGGTVPNLLGRMILGASDAHPTGSTGGSETHLHGLSGTVGYTTLSVAQMPTHNHGNCDILRVTNGNADYTYDGGQSHSTMDNTGGSSPHTHALSGASDAADSLPPYYAMAIIMRIA